MSDRLARHHSRGEGACALATRAVSYRYQPRPEFTQKFTDSEVDTDSTW